MAFCYKDNGTCRQVMLPIEKICDKDSFVRKDRESFYIKKFITRKKLPLSEIEHGLNLIKGQ